jgi:hypothetical protein
VKKRISGEDAKKMPIVYDELMALKNLGQKYAYTDREVMLYAYGIGMGADPMDEKELAFVNEAVATARPLKVVPTATSPSTRRFQPQPTSPPIPPCSTSSTRARTRAR